MRRLAVAALALCACIPHKEPPKAKTSISIALACAFDHTETRTVEGCPPALTEAIGKSLSSRNLKVRLVAPESFAKAFESKKTTAARLAHLAEGSPDAEAIALVETRATFYSQLSGRYRWTVSAKLSLAKHAALEQPLSSDLEQAVFLDLENEREHEALASARGRLADEAGRLADDFFGDALSARAPSDGGDAIYFVMVDRFANGDPSNDGAIDPKDPQAFHGGDLQGVLDHLDELARLGVGTVWLSPVFAMRTEPFHGHGAYHGYWVKDFSAVEPRFGDEALLARLSSELHRRGMKLVLDVVLNHVAFDAPLVTDHPDWFHHAGPLVDWNDPVQLETHDVQGLPDLAQEKPAVYDWLLASSLRWIDAVHPDGFRLDAARHIPLAFWRRYTTDVRAHAGKDFLLLGELYDGNAKTLSASAGQGGFTGVFDFPLHFAMVDVFCKGASPARLGSVLTNDRLYRDPSRLATFLDSHDLARIASACGGDESKVSDALTFLLTARGMPVLQYGTESGLTGAAEPENRGDMRFGADPALAGKIRDGLAFRRAHPELSTGASRMLAADDRFFAYARIGETGSVVIAVNHDRTARRVPGTDLEVAPGATSVFTLPSRLDPAPAVATPVRIPAPAGATVVGSAPELGSWDPAHGASAAVDLPPGVYEYKLVTRSGADWKWEPGDNHVLFVPPPAATPTASR